MKFKILVILVLAMASSLASETFKFQLALFNPVQIHSEEVSIKGARLNIYGKNKSLTGFDFGIVNHLGTGSSKALQIGWLGNIVEGDFEGVQYADLFNYSSSSLSGAQISAINISNDMEGLQFGLINFSDSIHGVQLGLLNFISEGGVLPIMPFINWDFD